MLYAISERYEFSCYAGGKSVVFCRFGCGIDMAIYRADAQFFKIDRRQFIRECPEADPVLISDKLGRYRISDQTGDSCGKLTAAQPAQVVCGLSIPRRNVRKKRVGFPLGESC